MLHQFEQHAIRRRRVNESDQTAARTHAWCFVDQPCAFAFQLRERRFDVANLDCNVMNPGTAFREKSSDGRFSAQRFEQFHVRITDRQHADSDALLGDFLCRIRFETQSIAPNREAFSNGGRGYPDVIDFHASLLSTVGD